MNATEIADVDRDVLTITTRGAHTWVTCTSGPNEVTVGPLPTEAVTAALPGRPLTGPAPAAPSAQLLEIALAAAVKDGHDARTRAEKLNEQLTRYSRSRGFDLADGGVTAACVEDEARGHDYTPCTHETDCEHWQARWQEVADQRDARDVAAHLWKETARRAVKESRKYLNVTRAYASTRDRAVDALVKAAKERDEARAEREEMRESLHLMAHSVKSRPLTADDVDGDMVNRALNEARSLDVLLGIASMRHILVAALTEPTRPEGAEEMQFDLAAFEDTDQPHTFEARADYLAALGWTKEQP